MSITLLIDYFAQEETETPERTGRNWRRPRSCNPTDFRDDDNIPEVRIRERGGIPSCTQAGHDFRLALYAARASLGLPLFTD